MTGEGEDLFLMNSERKGFTRRRLRGGAAGAGKISSKRFRRSLERVKMSIDKTILAFTHMFAISTPVLLQ
jgi:hypothetical protein